jgi:ADP-dependent NAD(P)H-hydrate dehydratase / NAD(P)H-hydrate epimerase
MRLATAEIMRNLDSTTIDKFGIPGVVLMENAGGRCARLIMSNFAEPIRDGVSVVCGTGNNGGDGFVIARHLWNNGYDVTVYLLGAMNKIAGDAKANFDIIERLEVPVISLATVTKAAQLPAFFEESGLIVDAVFGTGLDRPVTGRYEAAIEAINQAANPVFAVDMPSGLNSDTGRPMGSAVYADMTATFGLPKIGQWLYPGYLHSGRLVVVDISIPAEAEESIEIPYSLVGQENIFHLFAPRSHDVNKGSFGRALIVGGSPGFSGAVALAAWGAMRAGAGLVTAAVPARLHDLMEIKLTEAMTAPVAETDSGHFAEAGLDALIDLAMDKNVVAFGPGVGRNRETAEMLYSLLPELKGAVILDADGLNLLADNISVLKQVRGPVILTPHPGEMARLTGKTIQEVQADRVGIAREFARKHGVHLILKGAHSIIAEPAGEVFVNPTGNPGMATGGTGDVLTGILAGYLAQGFSVLDAVIAGVYMHGLAGDWAAELKGEKGLTACDLLDGLPEVTKTLERLFTQGFEGEIDEDK